MKSEAKKKEEEKKTRKKIIMSENDGSNPEQRWKRVQEKGKKRETYFKGGHKNQLIEIKVSRYFVQGIQL